MNKRGVEWGDRGNESGGSGRRRRRRRRRNGDVDQPTDKHTSNLSFLLHGQNFWRIKFTPKNANFSR